MGGGQISGGDRHCILEVCFPLALPDRRWLIPLNSLPDEEVFLIHCSVICNRGSAPSHPSALAGTHLINTTQLLTGSLTEEHSFEPDVVGLS